jgi:hypothetical protein
MWAKPSASLKRGNDVRLAIRFFCKANRTSDSGKDVLGRRIMVQFQKRQDERLPFFLTGREYVSYAFLKIGKQRVELFQRVARQRHKPNGFFGLF